MCENQREMTLEEWVNKLPPVHKARKEYERLKAERDARFTLEEVTAWLAEYHGKPREIPMKQWVLKYRETKQPQEQDDDNF